MRSVVGGVCINTGTIPSKTMREAVLHLSGYNYRSIYGMNYRVKEKITMADLAFRVQHVIKTEIDVTEAQLSRNGVEVFNGVASFVDDHHVKVDGPRGTNTYEADNIIIAVGTRPATSPKVPVNGKTIVNSDQVLDMVDLPKSLIVVGGGVIGVEYTCMFAALGVRVTLIEKRPRLLEFADQEIIEALSYHLRDSRVTMRLGEEVESVEQLPDGAVVANLESKKKMSGDALLYAVGRQGNIDDLNLAAAGIEPDNRGRIPVDKDFRTKAPHIFRGRRRDRLPGAGLGFYGAGADRRSARLWRRAHHFEPELLSVRHLYDSGDFVYRQDRGAADGRGRAVRSRRGVLSGNCARPDPWRHDGTPEADLQSRNAAGAGRAHHRRGRGGAGPHRPGRDDPERHSRLLHRHGVQLPHARRMLQGRRV
jgi:thioredoxin reductase